jgi:hypothetical protein
MEEYDRNFKCRSLKLVELKVIEICNFEVICDLDRSLKVTHLEYSSQITKEYISFKFCEYWTPQSKVIIFFILG